MKKRSGKLHSSLKLPSVRCMRMLEISIIIIINAYMFLHHGDYQIILIDPKFRMEWLAGWIVVACYLNDTGGDIFTCIYCITITNFKRDTSKYLYNIWKRTQLTSINLWIILAGYESRVTFNNGHGSVKSKYRQRLSVSIVLKLHIGRQNACSSVTGNFCWS